MKKVFFLILFFYANFLYAQIFDFSFQKPKLSVLNNFSYNIVSSERHADFYNSTILSANFSCLKLDCGVELSEDNYSFTFLISSGPKLFNIFDIKPYFLYNCVGEKSFFENNIILGLGITTQIGRFFNLTVKAAFLFKNSFIKSQKELYLYDASAEYAVYFDWFIANRINPFFHIDTASFFSHYISPTIIFSIGTNCKINEKIEVGGLVSATYVNIITAVPYHAEVTISSFVKFRFI